MASIPSGSTAGPHRTAAGFSVPLALALFIAVWTVACIIGNRTPHLDDVEQLAWVRALEWGYYKHPPLPTWLLAMPVAVVGWSQLAVYLASAATGLATLALFYGWMKRMRGEAYARVAVMAAACTTYLNWGLSIYNHNSVLQLVSTLCALAAWLAIVERRRLGWVAVGLAFGLGALTKYQIAMTVVSLLLFFGLQGGHRDAGQRRGLLLAALIALSMFTPHLAWLRSHDFGPIEYAAGTAFSVSLDPGARLAGAARWIADQVFNRTLPAWLLLGYAAWRLRAAAPLPVARPSEPTSGAPVTEPAPDAEAGYPAHAAAARSMILVWGLVPLAFIPLTGLLSGADLPLHWGATFLIFLVPVGMEALRGIDWNRIPVRRLLPPFLVLQGLMLVGFLMTSAIGPSRFHGGRWRDVDFRPIAAAIDGSARAALGGPIRIVSGRTDVAGAIALQLPAQPWVLVDGRVDRSPWLPPGALEQFGAVEVGPSADLANGLPLGPAYPDWSWRVRPPVSGRSTPESPR